MPKPTNGRILFLDMNSFFASCETAENPSLVGRPVIVVPTKGSCALSASYEAKAFGIRTGTAEREARFRCPTLIVIPARPKLCMAYHYRLITILNSLTPRVAPKSVDEAAIRPCANEDPVELAYAIKQKIWQQLGEMVNCSIGIGPNTFLAKLGTELQKPNGLVEIKLENLEAVYRQVQLRDLCGINYAMEKQLQQRGIYSVLDFYHAKNEFLRRSFGIVGERWWLRLHGYGVEDRGVKRKSLSHSHVLPPHYRAPAQAFVTLQRLVTKVGSRLRREKLLAGYIGLVIRFTNRTTYSHHYRITPAADALTLWEHAKQLWLLANPIENILQLAVWTRELTPSLGLPLPLFAKERKTKQLSVAIDKVNDKFGTDTLYFATLKQKASRAPDRISFTALFPIEFE